MCWGALRVDGGGAWSKEHLNHSVRGSLQAGQDKSGGEGRKGRKESYGGHWTVLRCSWG